VIVIADTGPINYLVLIDAVEILQPLYTRVIVPQAVVEELSQQAAPAPVLAWIRRPPFWLEVRPDPPYDPTLDFLDPGERAALSLAEAMNADELLIDERAGRTEAERRMLHVTGTLGVLADAYVAGLIDFDRALARLGSAAASPQRKAYPDRGATRSRVRSITRHFFSRMAAITESGTPAALSCATSPGSSEKRPG
jgi:predicted nucleic acid-binding protein